MVISSKSFQNFTFSCLAVLQPLNGFMFLQSWQTVSNLQSSLSRAIIGKVIYNIMFQNETLNAIKGDLISDFNSIPNYLITKEIHFSVQ